MNKGRGGREATPGSRGKASAGGQSRAHLLIGSGIGRKPPRPDRRAFIGSIIFHILLLGSLAFTTVIHDEGPEFITYKMKLISPPPQVRGEPRPVPPPQPRIVQAPQRVERPPAPEKKPEPVERRPEQTPVKQDSTPPPKPDTAKVAGNAPPDPKSVGGEGLNVDIEGAEFPFPEYLENIIRQINRYFRWEGDNSPEARVVFCVNRDGSVSGLSLIERSRDWKFNQQTMSAIEAIGQRKAFGPLPDGWVQERLCIRYRFLPPGR